MTQKASSKGQTAGYSWLLTNVQPTGRIATIAQYGVELSPFCRRVNTVVPLSTRGLDQSEASPFDDEWDCQAPRQVLLRLRAVFAAKAPTLRRAAPFGFPLLYAHRPVREGTLVMRTPSGKTLSVAKLFPSGTVQVFTNTAAGCFPD